MKSKIWSFLRVASAALFIAGSALAQNAGTVSNHAVPIGKGPGVAGYTSAIPGTAGFPLVSNGASSDPSFGASGAATVSFLQAGTGAISRTAQQELATAVRISQFGAVCDGVTDDRVAIQNAGNQAIAQGVALYIDPSANGCIVSQNGSNVYALAFSAPITIIGLPGRSIIRPAASLANIVSILYFTGSAISYQPTIVDGLFFGNPSSGTRTGFNAIVFDTTAAGVQFNRPQVRNTYFSAPATGSGADIFAVNNETNNPGGGLLLSDFGPNNLHSAGISLNKSGDSIKIHDGVFNASATSPNPGVYINLVNGTGGKAGNLEIRNMNGGANAGTVVIDCAASVLIFGGELEQQATNTEVNNSIIDVAGGVCSTTGVRIIAPQIQAIGGVGNPFYVRVGNAVGTVIDYGTFATPASYAPVKITASATGTVIGAGNSCVGCSALFSDLGSGTLQVPVTGSAPNTFGIEYSTGGNSFIATAAMTNGQLLVGQTGAAPLPKSPSQDCTVAASGAYTCTKTNNVAFAISATTDATNATNISSGTLPSARLGTVAGACTLADGSGASLVFTSTACEYNRIGNMVFIHGKLTYPSTANGASATVTVSGPGVNFLDTNACYLTTTNVATAARIFSGAGSISFNFITTAQSLVVNSTMSTGALSFACTYPAT